jgi:hypothetical protein
VKDEVAAMISSSGLYIMREVHKRLTPVKENEIKINTSTS